MGDRFGDGAVEWGRCGEMDMGRHRNLGDVSSRFSLVPPGGENKHVYLSVRIRSG